MMYCTHCIAFSVCLQCIIVNSSLEKDNNYFEKVWESLKFCMQKMCMNPVNTTLNEDVSFNYTV